MKTTALLRKKGKRRPEKSFLGREEDLCEILKKKYVNFFFFWGGGTFWGKVKKRCGKTFGGGVKKNPNTNLAWNFGGFLLWGQGPHPPLQGWPGGGETSTL